jgi:hypothetical protein
MADKNTTRVNPIQVQKYLKGLHYPVTKQDLVKTAKKEGADEDIMHALQQLPEQEYARPTDVTKAIGRLE